jgi:hypothetical protein
VITSTALSNRFFKFFNTLYGSSRTDFGFSADVNFAFIEDNQNNAIRPDANTILFYRIEENEKIGNQISSDSQIYNRETGKEIISTYRQITLVINILSKTKGNAKNAMQMLLALFQSTRMAVASYEDPFPLVLVNALKARDLTSLETGAWTERMEKTLYFRYNDNIIIGDIDFTQEVEQLEDVKDVYQYSINLKN